MMSVQFSEEMQRLKDELVILGGSVENAILCALNVLEKRPESYTDLNGHCRRIAQKRFLIERVAFGLLTFPGLDQTALRKVVAMMEVAGEFQRLADSVSELVDVCYHRLDDFAPEQLDSVCGMAADLVALLHRALVAFAKWDASLARATVVAASDWSVLYEQARLDLFDASPYRSNAPAGVACLARAAYCLKRGADSVAGCCGWIAFAVDGAPRIVRQRDREQVSKELLLQPDLATL